mmetsp:Transcript_38735/g.123164  ORF Transcript_38735/g.123164 Transcript_38735/m.123164 type:complete len:200 (-) Transcript_38735:472-1071(-)
MKLLRQSRRCSWLLGGPTGIGRTPRPWAAATDVSATNIRGLRRWQKIRRACWLLVKSHSFAWAAAATTASTLRLQVAEVAPSRCRSELLGLKAANVLALLAREAYNCSPRFVGFRAEEVDTSVVRHAPSRAQLVTHRRCGGRLSIHQRWRWGWYLRKEEAGPRSRTAPCVLDTPSCLRRLFHSSLARWRVTGSHQWASC